MKEYKTMDSPYWEYYWEIADDAYRRGKLEELEEWLMIDDENPKTIAALDHVRFLIAREAFARNELDKAEEKLKLSKGIEVEKLREQIRVAKLSPASYAPNQNAWNHQNRSHNTYPPIHSNLDVNETLDDIMMDSAYDSLPKIDSETELAMKMSAMTRNTIVMRGIVLRMEANLALINKNDGFLGDFNPVKVKNFDEIIININTQFKQSADCLIANKLEDADACLTKAEMAFVDLCPEKPIKKKTSNSDSNKSNRNILSNVKPANYQPSDRDALTVRGDNEDVVKCLRIAEKAIASSNFDKAKKFLEKAERIKETAAAKKLFECIRMTEVAKLAAKESAEARDAKIQKQNLQPKVNTEKDEVVEKTKNENCKVPEQETNNDYSRPPDNNTLKRNGSSSHIQEASTDGKKRRAGFCLQQAQEAYRTGNFQEAEKLAQKAQRVYQSTEAENFLTIVHSEISSGPEKKEDLDSNMNKYASKNNQQLHHNNDAKTNTAKAHLQKARDYTKSGHLDEAEKELNNAQKLDPNMDVDEVAATLRTARASRSSTDDATHSYVKGTKNNNSRVEKDYFINREIAETAKKEKSFLKADKFFKTCYGLKRTKSVENILKNLQIEIFEAQNVENTSADTDKIKDNKSNVNNSFIDNIVDANKFLQEARDAFKRDNLDDAEKLAMKSYSLNPGTKTQDLLGKIKNAKTKNYTYSSGGDILPINSSKNTLTGHEADKVDTQFHLLKKANELLDEDQLEKAENLASQAKQIRKCDLAETYLLRISELNQQGSIKVPKFNYGLPEDLEKSESNKNKVHTCIHVAERAIKENEYCHDEFVRYPTERVKALEQIQMPKLGKETREQKTIERTQENIATRRNSTAHKLSESSDDTSNTEIEKCIDIAKKAISSEDFPRAIKFLEKAQRIQPTDKTKSLLEDIQQSMPNETKAEKLVAYAMEAISDEDYDFAEMLLINARIKYKSVLAKQLLDQVKRTVSQAELVEQKIQKTKKPICKNNLGTTEKQQKYAEKYFKLAEKMEMEGSLEDSEVVLIIAQNTYPQNYAATLLTEVRNKLYARSPKWKSEYEWKFSKSAKQGIVSSEAYKYNCYVQMAERAHSVGNMNVAEDFLLVADSLCPSSHTKHLLKQVEKVKSFSAGPRKPSKKDKKKR